MTGSRPCRVLLVDDHPVVLSGIRSLVESQGDIEVVATAGDAESALEAVGTYRPDLVIVDGTLPGESGISIVEKLSEEWPDIRALALTLHEEGPYVREFLKAGARGFVLKRSAADTLLQAIRSVMQGGIYLDPAIASKVITISAAAARPTDTLSEREESVVRLVAEGFSNKEISRQLSISVKTVETYRARACEKLGLTTRAALVRHALQEGWLGSR